MHDRIYALQAQLTDENIREAAGEAGLDLAAFDKAMAAHTYAQTIADDRKHAGEVGAVGTPTFFINGQVLNGALPLDAFTKAIDAELKVVDAMLAAGAPEETIYDVRLAALPVGAPEVVRPKKAAPTAPQKAQLAKWTPVRGPALAKVTIVEYGDFQCPFCARAAQTMATLQKEYGNDLRIAYRHNPLAFHAHACELAEVAMAAAEQGKFWEMLDYIYAHQQDLDEQKYEDSAQADPRPAPVSKVTPRPRARQRDRRRHRRSGEGRRARDADLLRERSSHCRRAADRGVPHGDRRRARKGADAARSRRIAEGSLRADPFGSTRCATVSDYCS